VEGEPIAALIWALKSTINMELKRSQAASRGSANDGASQLQGRAAARLNGLVRSSLDRDKLGWQVAWLSEPGGVASDQA
jgi:hypothetical protein